MTTRDQARIIADRLTLLLGLQELLLEDAYGPLTARQQEVLRDLLRASEDLCELLAPGAAPRTPA